MSSTTRAIVSVQRIGASTVVVRLSPLVEAMQVGMDLAAVEVSPAAYLDIRGLHFKVHDELVLTDAQAKEFFKGLADQFGVVDVRVKEFGKGLSEVLNLQETFGRTVSFTRAYADTVAVSDAVTVILTFVESAADTVATVDAFSRTIAFARTFADSIAASDAFSRQADFSRSPADSVTPGDAFSRQATFGRDFADTAAVADSLAKSFDRTAAADTVVASDAGSLLSQGYADVDYFAADYVGQSLTF